LPVRKKYEKADPDEQLAPQRVREWLSVHQEIVHSTIEIQRCEAV
jgi:hypothetical protein